MKIAIITNLNPRTGGGRYAFEIFRRLKEKIDVDLIYCNENEKLIEKNRKIKFIKGENFPAYKKTLNAYFVYPRKIPNGYDAYHVTNQLLTRTIKFRKPSILTILDLIMLKKGVVDSPALTKMLMRRALKYSKYAEKIITISNHTKNDVKKILGIPETKLKTIYLGVDSKTYRPRSKKSARRKLKLELKRKIVLNIGSEEKRKNIATVLKSINMLRKYFPDILLVRVGEKGENSTKLIDELNLEKNVLYLKNISDVEQANLCSAADVFVFPSIYEGFGLPPLEAMSSGCPTITTNLTSLKEFVGTAVLKLEDPYDPKKLSELIKRVFTKDNLRKSLIQKGIKQARKFTWEKCAKETLKIYKDVLTKNH